MAATQTRDEHWLNHRFYGVEKDSLLKPHELEKKMKSSQKHLDATLADRICGSMLGTALGDALGAHVEFRPHSYMIENPVTDLDSGGTWGLEKGQFTDDTSMALCLAASLIVCQDFNLYDQLVRYKWWYRHGYMSSTGDCFDIGTATRISVEEFERRQNQFGQVHKIPFEKIDTLTDTDLLKQFDVKCSEDGVAGNGALMRLAPVPLFFHRHPSTAVEYAGQSGQITHGDRKVYDACRYYGALIVAALYGKSKAELLDDEFYTKHKEWFGKTELHVDILSISQGSYKKEGGHDDGIRGGGYIVKALEAALWAFWSTDSFEKGALAAVNLGDDTDTTAAIYGQLAGAFYGRKNLSQRWLEHLYAKEFIINMAEWLILEGQEWFSRFRSSKPNTSLNRSQSVQWTRIISQTIVSLKASDYSQCLRWSVDDVIKWIQSWNPDFKKYVDRFRNAKVDGQVLLFQIDPHYLGELGIDNVEDQTSIMNGIKTIKDNVSADFYKLFSKTDDFVSLVEIMEAEKKGRKPNTWKIRDQVNQWIKSLPNTMTNDGIEFAHTPDLYRCFLQEILSIEYKKKQKNIVESSWDVLSQTSNPEMFRRLIYHQEETKHTRSEQVCIVRAWYGCSHEEMSEITAHGFERKLRLGAGREDKGFLLRSSAKAAAHDVGVAGCVLMCYVILSNPFCSLINEGSTSAETHRYRFYSDGKPSITEMEYESMHFSGSTRNYRPIEEIQAGFHDEFVTFESKNILPQVVVYLRPIENDQIRLCTRTTSP